MEHHQTLCSFPRPRAPRPATPSALLGAAVLTALLRTAAAQVQFEELPRHALPAGQGTLAIAVGDVDGDGSLDFVFGRNGQNRLYLNNGHASFTDVTVGHLPLIIDRTRAVVLGDVDGDGDLDLICGNDSGGYTNQDRLYLNNGGVFTDVTATHMPISTGFTRSVAIGDVDGDGDLDLVLAGVGHYAGGAYAAQQTRLYLNNGHGVFTDATVSRLPQMALWTNAVALVDVDGDGDRDLILGNGGQNSLWLNDGTGTFTDVTAAHLPAYLVNTTSLALGDVDGDGDLDLVCGTTPLYSGGCSGGKGSSYLPTEPNRLFINNGQGVFQDVTIQRLPAVCDLTNAVALGDIDGDGDLDLVCGNASYLGTDRLLLNDGSGTFTEVSATYILPNSWNTYALALGDFDGDGDLDLIRSGQGNDHLELNLQRQLYAPSALRAGHVYTLTAR